jgi:hypothetical protein
MIFVRVIDENGFFVGDDFVEELTPFTIETPCPEGFYKPKWDGIQWVEGLTPEEIAAIQTAAVPQLTVEELQQKIDELQTQLNAIQAG